MRWLDAKIEYAASRGRDVQIRQKGTSHPVPSVRQREKIASSCLLFSSSYFPSRIRIEARFAKPSRSKLPEANERIEIWS